MVDTEESLLRLGAKIRQLRKERGWSQEKLEHQCGLTRGAISSIENGKAAPKVTTLWSLAHHLGTTAQNILDGIDPFNST